MTERFLGQRTIAGVQGEGAGLGQLGGFVTAFGIAAANDVRGGMGRAGDSKTQGRSPEADQYPIHDASPRPCGRAHVQPVFGQGEE
ncbi:hypothetical protein [Paenibacillus sp. DMB20]|uniref:hypothetical protein n=1 Tax=Paenibacillus sp. DMB20 TaxID=1642570 RepID=UPI001F416407|nr:hypothetical protein [Paenibacillus sp. DMB20]